MFRPLFLIGFTLVWVLLMIGISSEITAFAILIASGISFVSLLFSKEIRHGKAVHIVLATAALACALYFANKRLGYNPSIQVLNFLNGRFGDFFENIRLEVKSTLRQYLPDRYAYVLLGMLIGDKKQIPDDIYMNFEVTGIVHLLSVSGFHTSLWSALVYKGLLKSGCGKRLSVVVSVGLICAFLALTGFAKSTIRASVMLIIFMAARFFKRESDSLNSLGFAATVIILLDPTACENVGFILSFFSTLGILTLYPRMKMYLRPITKRFIHNFRVRGKINDVIDVVLISISTFVVTFPMIMQFIGCVSLISPLANLLITTFASSAIFLAGIGVILNVIPFVRVFSNTLFLISGFMTKCVVDVSELLSRLPFAQMDVSGSYMKVTVAALLILWACDLLLKIQRPRLTATLSGFIMAGSIISHNIWG